MLLQIKKTSDKAIIPTKGSKYAAGYDLFSIEESVSLQHSERRLFKTGIHIQIPPGYYGRIAPRSGLALKQGIDILAGVIDADYTGEIGVILINLNNMPVTVDTSKAIAQLIIEKYHDVDFIEVSKLDETTRNENGFGSTDEKKKEKPIAEVFTEEVRKFEASKKNTVVPSIMDKYTQVGGVKVPKSYSDQIKQRDQ